MYTTMKKTFETELPQGYTPVKVIDAKAKKTAIIFNVVSTVITLLFAALAVIVLLPPNFFEGFAMGPYFVFFGSLFAYIVLHELLHGLAYWLLTKQKLTFGVTLSVAFCGVPHIYVYRKTALISLLAPFTVFTLVFGAAALWLPDAWYRFYALLLFGIHFGGCVGDLYDTLLYLFKFLRPDTLMQDTGPKQTFYVKQP